jgi:hypothetical protein
MKDSKPSEIVLVYDGRCIGQSIPLKGAIKPCFENYSEVHYMQVAARRLSLQPSSTVPVCCIIAESGTAGGAAARWQVLAQALEQSPHRQILSLLFLEPLAHAQRILESLITSDARQRIRFHEVPAHLSPSDNLASYIEDCLQSNSATETPILVIDSLESAIIQFGAANVLTTLHALEADGRVSGMLFDIHSEAIQGSVLACMHRLATCVLLLRKASALQSEVIQRTSGAKVHTEAIACTIRHSGLILFQLLFSRVFGRVNSLLHPLIRG